MPNREEIRENMWRSKFVVQPIIYAAQDKCQRDVRTFLFDRSYILEKYVDHYKLRGQDDNETMYKILMWTIDNFKYMSDEDTRKQVEYWQNPEESLFTMTGDCEDGSLLMKSLSLVAGVPDWKVKVLAGDVKGGGHAYLTYIRDDESQVILDWCYWPNRLPINSRPVRESEPNYYKVWFSFDKLYGYAPKATTYTHHGEIQVCGFKIENSMRDC
jgi:predicted transglutaminase-like cysteine proteinase